MFNYYTSTTQCCEHKNYPPRLKIPLSFWRDPQHLLVPERCLAERKRGRVRTVRVEGGIKEKTGEGNEKREEKERKGGRKRSKGGRKGKTGKESEGGRGE